MGRPLGGILSGSLPQFADPLVDARGHLPHGRPVRTVSQRSEGERNVEARVALARGRLGCQAIVEHGGHVGYRGEWPFGDGSVEGGARS